MKTSTGKEATYEFPWEQPPAPKLGIDQCKTQDILYPDVMIVGSGPLGATYARKILTDKPAATVMMAEMGAQESVVVGEHKKNSVAYQRDIDSFVHVIKGALGTYIISASERGLYVPPMAMGRWESRWRLCSEGSEPRPRSIHKPRCLCSN